MITFLHDVAKRSPGAAAQVSAAMPRRIGALLGKQERVETGGKK
jgi:hypothetical protein